MRAAAYRKLPPCLLVLLSVKVVRARTAVVPSWAQTPPSTLVWRPWLCGSRQLLRHSRSSQQLQETVEGAARVKSDKITGALFEVSCKASVLRLFVWRVTALSSSSPASPPESYAATASDTVIDSACAGQSPRGQILGVGVRCECALRATLPVALCVLAHVVAARTPLLRPSGKNCRPTAATELARVGDGVQCHCHDTADPCGEQSDATVTGKLNTMLRAVTTCRCAVACGAKGKQPGLGLICRVWQALPSPRRPRHQLLQTLDKTSATKSVVVMRVPASRCLLPPLRRGLARASCMQSIALRLVFATAIARTRRCSLTDQNQIVHFVQSEAQLSALRCPRASLRHSRELFHRSARFHRTQRLQATTGL